MLLIALLLQLFGMPLALVGCGSPSQPQSIVGNWTGTVTDSSGHTGSATLSLTEDRHAGVDGTFSYMAGECSLNSQPLLGKAAGLQVSLSQSLSDPILTRLQLTVDASEQHISGTYSNANGFCASNGTLNLTKP